MIINGKYYPDKHPERDTLSSGKRGFARKLEERRLQIEAGIDPDTIDPSRINPKKACPFRGDML